MPKQPIIKTVNLQVQKLAAAIAQLQNATLASAMRAWKASTAAALAKKQTLACAVSHYLSFHAFVADRLHAFSGVQDHDDFVA